MSTTNKKRHLKKCLNKSKKRKPSFFMQFSSIPQISHDLRLHLPKKEEQFNLSKSFSGRASDFLRLLLNESRS